ncbi:MAG: PIG-L family deacetylase [Patescibacteria group bacterium]|jgi:LmbE family N-acetylglucosaminyl deacetylase
MSSVHTKATSFAKSRKVRSVAAICLILGFSYLIYFRYFGSLPQATIELFSNMPPPTQTDVIDVFAPHQDDETLGVGGYIASATESGAKVNIIFATDGNKRGLKQTRSSEATKAGSILGVLSPDISFYNYPDSKLSKYSAQLEKSINETLAQTKPTIIFVTDPFDDHPDHSQLGTAVINQASSLSNVKIYSYLIHYKAFPRPQDYNINNALLPPISLIDADHKWLKYNLSTGQIDQKNEAVLQYKSQLRTPFLHSLLMSFIRQNELFIQK